MRFRSADERRIVEMAKSLGWSVEGRNGRSHLVVKHPRHGTIPISGSSGGPNTLGNLRRTLERGPRRTAQTQSSA